MNAQEQLTGVAYGLPAAQYFSQPHISKSGLDQIAKSPAHYRYWLDAPREDTRATLIGSAVHCAVLEPAAFADRYVVAPDGLDKRTKEGKAAFAELEASGKIILKDEDHRLIMDTARTVLNHPTAKELWVDGKPEVSVFTEIDGAPAKCRVDWLIQSGVAVDLKTTESAGPRDFARSVTNYRYHVQAAFYLDCLAAAGLPCHTFLFVAVEKAPPYGVGIYELDPLAIELGRELYRRDLALWKHCMAIDEWPGYSTEIETLTLPAWAFSQAA